MLQLRLIEEVAGDNPRRKYYTLTEKGNMNLERK
jgi:DNA-binding PadR family transcriptional regulator